MVVRHQEGPDREDVQTSTGAAGDDPKAWRQRRAATRYPDVAGIMHLMQFALGKVGGDGTSSRSIL
jgi:hypothetical protein